MPLTVKKRNKEKARQEKQQDKAARRDQRRRDREARPATSADGETDMDIAGIVPGPQPIPEY